MSRHSTLPRRSRHLVSVLILVSTGGCLGQPAVPDAPSAPAAASTQHVVPAPQDDGRVLGAADAPVSIIEFTDLQCPYCARFARETWPRVRKEYVDTGKVRFATRDLPLRFHAFAVPAAVATRCAGAQGKHWEYREALFNLQSQLGSEPYARLASQLGLDGTRFEACRADPATLQSVQDDAALAAASGITGTPSFVIGRVVAGSFTGEVISGAGSFEEFAARIEALLKVAQQ